MNIEKTCAFTGHRNTEAELDEENIEKTVERFIEEGYEVFLCGMAMGFDLIAADIVLKLKKKYDRIKLVACVPCPDQERYFSKEDKQKYKRIIGQCDEVKIISDHYFKGCMFMRDRYMVDNSSLVIAYYRTQSGGTYYTVKYAVERGKRLILV